MKKLNMLMGATVALTLVMTAPVLASRSEPGSDDCQNSAALTADEARVCANFHNMVEDARRLDAEAVLDHFWSDGFTAALAGELIRDFPGWADGYRSLLATTESLDRVDFPDVVVQTIAPDTILLLNTYDQLIVMQSQDVIEATGYGTQVWVRRDGEWRIIHIAGE